MINCEIFSFSQKFAEFWARGTSILGGGGPGPDIKIRGKNWGKVLPSSPNKRKNMGKSVTTRRKTWKRIIVLGAFGIIPETQRAKFGVFVIHIFGGKFQCHNLI